MPFEVFRRHQRKLMAVFAILAMFGFVVSDSLPRWLSGSTGGRENPLVVNLYGSPVRRADLNEVAMERQVANRFMTSLIAFLVRGAQAAQPFGGYTDRDLVDALILDRQADDLGLPGGVEVARQWLTDFARRYDAVMTREVFELAMSPLADQFTGEQVLGAIGREVRRNNVAGLLASPMITPLDVFESYRGQNERVAVRAAAFPVERFVEKVPQPTDEQVRAFYEKSKDVLPDPVRDTPGFKIPRQVVVESLSIDGSKLADELRAGLTDEELRTSYENRKREFEVPSEFPRSIFADDPEGKLTPPQTVPFEEVRTTLAAGLAEDKAQSEILDRFARIKDEVMYPFVDRYLEAVEDGAEAKKSGREAPALPRPDDLSSVAAREGLTREVTPPLTREAAENYGGIGLAQVGLNRSSTGRRFVEEVFDAKTPLYEPFELTSIDGTRYLARKLEDNPPRVPALDEIRDQVVAAWRSDQARELARKAADAYAETVRKAGGKITDEIVEGRPVVVTDPVSKLQPRLPLSGQYIPPMPTLLPEFPYAGDALRDAIFGLREGQVAVAPNDPKTAYYVLTLDRREPATFDRLFGASREYLNYQRDALNDAQTRREDDVMTRLRTAAGIEAGWVPEDEREKAEGSRAG